MPDYTIMSTVFRPALIGLAGLLSTFGSLPVEGQDTARQRLAAIFAREASRVVSTAYPMVPEMELATEMLQQSIELDPTNIEYRRRLLSLAKFAEDDEARRVATADLAQLAPTDQGIQLARLNDALAQQQTAEGLDRAYAGLLENDTISQLAPAVASRLAFDYAILKQRMGDSAAYAHWIGLATSLDQTNKPAAATAAGYFRMNEQDPFAEAELLVNLLVADPTDITTQTSLARHMLDHGAYPAARVMYRMAIESHEPGKRPLGSNLIADQALAQWASGEHTEAFDTIRRHKNELNRLHQLQAQINDPGMPPEERLQLRATFPPTLHAVNIAMLDQRGGEQVTEAVAEFRRTLQGLIEGAEQRIQPAEQVELLLMQAWMTLWFTDDTPEASSVLAQATAIKPLSETAQARFDGWIALRRLDLPTAEALLDPIAMDDVAARLGLALVRLEQGRRRDAARLFLAVSRDEPGTVMGVWARHRLASILGQEVPPQRLASDLNELVSALPPSLIGIPRDPSRVLSLRVEPVKRRFRPFEPILVRLELTNNSNFPLGIGTHAAIQPIILVRPRVTISTQPRVDLLPPIVIDLGRFLRIDARDSVEIEFDLRSYYVGGLLDLVAVSGASVDLRATVNPVVVKDAIEPTLLGSVRRTRSFRVDGVNRSREWFEDVIGLISQPDAPEDSVLMALLAHAVAAEYDTPGDDEEMVAIIEQARTTLSQSWAKLDPYAQAWVLAVLPVANDVMEPIMQLARSSQEPVVQLTFLLGHVHEADDPMLLAAERGEDGRTKRVAQLRRAIDEMRASLTGPAGGQDPEGN